MSDLSSPARRSPSPWWGLLLFPIALFVGWFVGRVPAPEHAVTGSVASGTGPEIARADAPPGTPSPSARGGDVAPSADPAPGQSETPEAHPPGTEFSQWTTLENATSESQRNGKPVLIDFNADWCGPCQALKHEVFEDGARGQLVQTAVIPVSVVDRNREDGSNPPETESLQQRFQVEVFPTLVVYSPQTGRMVKTTGFGDPERTLQWITEAAKQVR